MLDQLNADIKTAMKAKEADKLQALRYLKSMLMENSTSKKPVADMDVVVKHYKKLNDSLVNFPEGHEMREKTLKELEFIKAYMPEQMDEAAVSELIEKIKSGLENPNMGAIMKELQPQIKGKFDGKKASEMVKAALN